MVPEWLHARGGYAHIGRQHGVEHKGKLFRRDGAVIVKMRALAGGVHARVRAAGPPYGGFAPRGAGERALQFLLNRAQPGLPLPAVKGRAVVLDGQQHPLKGLKIRHGNTFFVKNASSL